MSAVFAVEQIAHGFAASGVGAFVGLPSFRGFRSGSGGVFFTAFGTAVGETRLAGFQFEFFAANYANFNRICHVSSNGFVIVCDLTTEGHRGAQSKFFINSGSTDGTACPAVRDGIRRRG